MTYDPETLRTGHVALLPTLELLCGELKAWLAETVDELGLIDARVEARVKSTYSLLNKARRKAMQNEAWSDPLVQARDKVGVRADLVYLAEVDRLADRVATLDFFSEVIPTDKTAALGIHAMGYHGLHFTVLPVDLPDGWDPQLFWCEVQIRTNAQAAWAMAEHDLSYKVPEDLTVPSELGRAINRWTVLLELFDEGVRDARSAIMGTNGYPLAILTSKLEELRTRFTALHHDRELTRLVLTELGPPADAETTHNLVAELETYVMQHESDLMTVYAHHLAAGPGGSMELLVQPEALLVFFLLTKDRFEINERWAHVELPYQMLKELASMLAINLPTPG